ncbi:MAG: protein kinase, partial [Candidatus Zixiibacteriota bacterium]
MKCPKCDFENPDDTRFCGKCGTQLPSSEEISVSGTKTFQASRKELTVGGTFAGRYQVIEELGKGGMGRVYKVFDKEIKDKVALKLLNPEIASDKQTIERFRNELKLARKISHRNVCRMFDLSKEEGTHFITMEYVSGEDLKSSIRRVGPLSAGKAIFIAGQICEGLSEAHRLGVVHRDLKPQNIMIDRDGNARIMDFGIARSLKAKGITDAGVMIGTPEYMSVEQVEGKKVDQRSDIYSLGVILYEMVTGRVPFEGDTPLTIAVKHKSEAPPDPRKINAQVPEDLSRVILRCMEKDRENRYQGVDELLSELGKIEKGIPTTERVLPKTRPSTSREITVTFSLRKLLIPALIVVAIVAIAVTMVSLVGEKEVISPPPGNPSLAIMYFDNLADPEDTEKLGKIVTNLLITDLSESQYLEVVSSQRLYDILKLLGREGATKVDQDVASQVAAKTEAKWMLLGSILQVKPQVILTAQLVDVATGNAIASQRITGDRGEKIFSIVDKLTVEVKKDLSLPAQAQKEEDPQVAEVTTHSPEAYRYYLEGVDYFWKLYNVEAEKSFMKALEIDSSFAMAYFWLAVLRGGSELSELTAKAVEYSDKVSQKEKHYIKAQEAQISGNHGEAIKELKKVVERYPEDKFALLWLGAVYWNALGDLEAAARQLTKAIEIDPLYKFAYNMLAYIYNDIGNFEKSIWAINKYISLAPDEPNPYDSRADLYAYNGKIDQAIESYRKALELKPDFYTSLAKRGHMYLFTREYSKAESCYKALASSSDKVARSKGRTCLALIPLYQGRLDEALRILGAGITADRMEEAKAWQLEKHFRKATIYREKKNLGLALEETQKAMEISREVYPQEPASHWEYYVRLLTENNEIAKAEEAANAFRKDIEEKDPSLMYLHWYTLGFIEWSRGSTEAALSEFEKLGNATPDFWAHFTLAEAYLESDRLGEAVAEFEKVLSRYDNNRALCAFRAVKAHYLLGLAYEKSGWDKKAIEQYE